MSSNTDSGSRSLFGAWRYLVMALCCVALVACKSPDDGGGRGDSSDSSKKGTTGG